MKKKDYQDEVGCCDYEETTWGFIVVIGIIIITGLVSGLIICSKIN